MRPLSGKALRGEVMEGRYCSRQCRAASRRIYTNRAERKRAQRARTRSSRGLAPLGAVACAVCNGIFKQVSHLSKFCCDECRREEARRRAREMASAAFDRPPRDCRECGSSFSPTYGSKRRFFCSAACAGRHERRAKRKKERARLYAAHVETVHATEVFERDGWRCQLCGVRTPRVQRGTFAPTAPELDHIQPLSAGGEHSYRNVQCACRACNAAKSNKPLGQMRLLG